MSGLAEGEEASPCRDPIIYVLRQHCNRYSSWSSVLLPVRVPASSNGWHWPKRAGWEANGMDQSDELTDDEGDE